MAVTWKKLAYETDVITKAFMATTGDILYASSGGTPAVLGIGSDNHILRVATNIPAWEAIGAPDSHQASHSPQDGSDALDCAAPAELVGVQASGEGNADTLARSNHAHQIQASIADDHLVTVDDATPPTDGEVAVFTAVGIEGQTPAEVAATMALDDIGVPDAAVDFNGQEATDLVLHGSAEPPATAVVGKIYMDTDLYAYICTVAA